MHYCSTCDHSFKTTTTITLNVHRYDTTNPTRYPQPMHNDKIINLVIVFALRKNKKTMKERKRKKERKKERKKKKVVLKKERPLVKDIHL